jgi:large subunit ribosomal protein L25
MSETTEISAIERTRVGKGSARAARRAGMVPAVIYGDKQSPLSIELEARVIRKIIHEPGIFGRLLNINVDGTVSTVLTRDIQMHPVTDEPLHMDMLRVGKQSTVAVAVPVEFINEGLAPGLKIGGVLNIVRHEIELNCPAGNIPEKIVIDLSGVNVGDSIHISAVNLPSDATPTITDRDFTIATLQSPGGGVKNLDEEDEEAGEEASAEEGESTE